MPKAKLKTITLPALKKGEHYAGILLNKGKPAAHLILLHGELVSGTWSQAGTWAKKQGGELPTRQEQSLLFANLKEQFTPNYYWSAEQHADASAFAWAQSFTDGYQGYWPKDAKGRARAVRRSYAPSLMTTGRS